MGKVVEIGISKKKGDIISKVNFIEVIKNKGLINDRNFNDNSDKKNRLL